MQPSAHSIESILAAAVEMSSEVERRAFVERACAGDVELQRRVEALIDNHFRAGSFLESPAPSPDATVEESFSAAPGTGIGPYRLLEQIGEGGMGLVFVAEQQQPVRRQVALKLIKPGMDTREVIRRFEAERQALALMDHPNIARVLDAGATAQGRPYFVMELVYGIPLTQFCDEHRLALRARLELFLAVCQAVQHAHTKGIIHRDLKPSNLLVSRHEGTPLVKVIDFGVAKAVGQPLTDQTMHTHFLQMIGTPLYMSPEQAGMSELDIDTRTDIYALGALLYELLTGTTPLDKERLRGVSYEEIRRLIREEEPARPSTRLSTLGQTAVTVSANRQSDPKGLSQLFRGELDWIVMKCLEKDRNRRYETASALAADVQRYLHDEPVQACPPSAWYRFRKFVRRRKVALVTALVMSVAVLVVASSIGWTLYDRHERRSRAAHEIERAVQESKRLQSLRRWPDALAYAEHAEDILNRVDGQESLRSVVSELLKDLRMLGWLEELGLRKSEAVVENSKTNLQQSGFANPAAEYGPIFRAYGLDPLALEIAEAARRIRERSIADYLVEALDSWSRLEPDKATRERLLALAREVNPDGVLARWREAVHKGDQEAMRKVLAGLQIGAVAPDTLAFLGRSAFTNGLTRESLALFRAAHLRYPESFQINSDLAYACTQLEPPQLDEAARHYTAALALRPKNAFVYLNLGMVLMRQDKRDAALTISRKALELKPDLAAAHNNLGVLFKQQGKRAEAEAALRRAIKFQPNQAAFYNNLARLLAEDPARRQEALACFDRALELNKHLANAYSGIGALQDDRDKAIAAFQKAIACDPSFAEAHHNLGGRYLDWGKAEAAKGLTASAQDKFDKASARFQDALTLFKAALPGKPASAEAHYNLGAMYSGWGEAEAAKGLTASARDKFDKAIARFQDALALDKNYARAWYSLGNAARDRGLMKTAISAFAKAAEIRPKDALASYNLGNMYVRLGQYGKANEAYQKALAADPNHLGARLNMSAALLEQGKIDEAEKVIVACLPRKKEDPTIIFNLAVVLDRQGRWADAVALLKREKEKLPEGGKDQKDFEGLLALYQQFVEVDRDLPAILSGKKAPASVAQRLLVAEVCLKKQRYAAAVRMYQDAFAEQPAVVSDPGNGYRVEAAFAAACAGCGLDQSSPSADAAQCAKWRKQALAWLRADLTLWSQHAKKGDPKMLPVIIKALECWRHHVHLAGVRAAALDKLPPDERAAWGQLWADVDDLLQRMPIP
jgi:serine/threonine protein kinase/Flp pilus assembly protein TadD